MYQTINNHTIYYQKTGRGKDLVLLHGWRQDVSTWWGIVELLKDDFTLWMLDLPGFGRSETPKKPFTVKDYSEIVSGFIKGQKIKNPVLLGHSLGGRVAIKLASISHTGSVILEDAAGIKTVPMVKEVFLAAAAKTFKFLVPDIFNLKDKLRHLVYRSLDSDYEDVGELRETFVNLTNEDLTPDLAKIKSETLLIWGEKDRAVPLKMGKKMYKLIENSRIEVLDGIGHFPHLENPERFVYWVRNFCIDNR
jgi:pimeloyl-ACP methyl ester carboxylesterase